MCSLSKIVLNLIKITTDAGFGRKLIVNISQSGVERNGARPFAKNEKTHSEWERTEKSECETGGTEGRCLGRLCLSPRAQLRQHHGDRCLHSPQFEQCPAVLGHTAHSFVLFRVAAHPAFASSSSYRFRPRPSSDAIPDIPR